LKFCDLNSVRTEWTKKTQENKPWSSCTKGEIHWGDETALTNTDVRGRSYAPAGQTPVTYAPGGKREKLSMIATVTNQGKARWMIIDEAFNADKLIEFFGSLDQGYRQESVFDR
jgi:hypothetical protein